MSVNKHRINRPLGPRSEATWGRGFTEKNTIYTTFATRQYRIGYSGFYSSGYHEEKRSRLALCLSTLYIINASFTGNLAIRLPKLKMTLKREVKLQCL